MFIIIPILLILFYVLRKTAVKRDEFKQKSIDQFAVAIVLTTTIVLIMLNTTTDAINPAIKYTVLGISIIVVIENLISSIKNLRKSNSSSPSSHL